MQGVFNEVGRRFKFKKQLKQAVQDNQYVLLEGTSMFDDEYTGPLLAAPDGDYYVVGPDPYTDRRWYAQIVKHGDQVGVR
jgi:hypothetical protein